MPGGISVKRGPRHVTALTVSRQPCHVCDVKTCCAGHFSWASLSTPVCVRGKKHTHTHTHTHTHKHTHGDRTGTFDWTMLDCWTRLLTDNSSSGLLIYFSEHYCGRT